MWLVRDTPHSEDFLQDAARRDLPSSRGWRCPIMLPAFLFLVGYIKTAGACPGMWSKAANAQLTVRPEVVTVLPPQLVSNPYRDYARKDGTQETIYLSPK